MSERGSQPETIDHEALKGECESFAIAFRDFMMSSEEFRTGHGLEIPFPHMDLAPSDVGSLRYAMNQKIPPTGYENPSTNQLKLLPFLDVEFDENDDTTPPEVKVVAVPFRYPREGRLCPELEEALGKTKLMTQLLHINPEISESYRHVQELLKSFFVSAQRTLNIQTLTSPPFDATAATELFEILTVEPSPSLIRECVQDIFEEELTQKVLKQKRALEPELGIPLDATRFSLWLPEHKDDLPLIYRRAMTKFEGLTEKMKAELLSMYHVFSLSEAVPFSQPPSVLPRLAGPVRDTSEYFSDAFKKSPALAGRKGGNKSS